MTSIIVLSKIFFIKSDFYEIEERSSYERFKKKVI